MSSHWRMDTHILIYWTWTVSPALNCEFGLPRLSESEQQEASTLSKHEIVVLCIRYTSHVPITNRKSRLQCRRPGPSMREMRLRCCLFLCTFAEKWSWFWKEETKMCHPETLLFWLWFLFLFFGFFFFVMNVSRKLCWLSNGMRNDDINKWHTLSQ